MNKILCILVCCFLPFFLFSDVAPSDMHPVDHRVMFTNLDDFPEIVLLGFILGPTYDSPHFFIIENNTELQKGYKFNDFGLYWASKKYVEHVGIDNIFISLNQDKEHYGGDSFTRVTYDPNIHFITNEIDPGDFWVDDFDHLKAQTNEYKVAGFIGDEIVIYQAKQTKYYSDNDSEIKTYDLPEIINLSYPAGTEASSETSSE